MDNIEGLFFMLSFCCACLFPKKSSNPRRPKREDLSSPLLSQMDDEPSPSPLDQKMEKPLSEEDKLKKEVSEDLQNIAIKMKNTFGETSYGAKDVWDKYYKEYRSGDKAIGKIPHASLDKLINSWQEHSASRLKLEDLKDLKKVVEACNKKIETLQELARKRVYHHDSPSPLTSGRGLGRH